MKTLSGKLNDQTFNDMQKIILKLKLEHNQYINEALSLYNQCNKRKLLKKQLRRESILTQKESMKILAEFEDLMEKD